MLESLFYDAFIFCSSDFDLDVIDNLDVLWAEVGEMEYFMHKLDTFRRKKIGRFL